MAPRTWRGSGREFERRLLRLVAHPSPSFANAPTSPAEPIDKLRAGSVEAPLSLIPRSWRGSELLGGMSMFLNLRYLAFSHHAKMKLIWEMAQKTQPANSATPIDHPAIETVIQVLPSTRPRRAIH